MCISNVKISYSVIISPGLPILRLYIDEKSVEIGMF